MLGERRHRPSSGGLVVVPSTEERDVASLELLETEMTADFEQLVAELAGSIRLGYEAERDDPNLGFEIPSADEIRWLADWLVSEGWTRSEQWPHG